MATKNGCSSSKIKTIFDSDFKCNNINLNQSHERSSFNSNSHKNLLINKNYDCNFNGESLEYRNRNEYEPDRKALRDKWDTQKTALMLHESSIRRKGDKNEWKKSDKEFSINNNSTLSLHISAYENSLEAVDSNCHNSGFKLSKEKKTWKNDDKNLFINSSLIIQNSFEFPRQQENQNTEPSIMQYKSSQKLVQTYPTESVLYKTKKEVSKDVKNDTRKFIRRSSGNPKKSPKISKPNYPPPPPPNSPPSGFFSQEKMASRGQLVMEDMLKEVQNLVDGLKNKNEVAEWCLAQGNVVTDKLAVMKEYNQEVGYVNTFHAPEGRANLVASLQHESRQIQALQEENRQLEYAIEEMEHGMEMMMAKHREIVLNCTRSGKMMDLLAKLQLTPTPSNSEKTMEMAKLLQECLDEHAEENSKYLKDVARLRTENSVLRRLLHVSSSQNLKIDAIIDKIKDSAIPDDLILKYFSSDKNDEEQDESSKIMDPDTSNSDSTESQQQQTSEILSTSNIPTPKNSKSNIVSKAKVQTGSTSKN